MRTSLALVFVLLGLVIFQACTSEQVSTVEINVMDFSAQIDENPTAGQKIGDLNATTTSGSLSYTLLSESVAGAFEISSLGALSVGDPTVFDFETNPTITASVEAAVEGVSRTIAVTVMLNDVAEGDQQLVVNDFEVSFMENPENGALIGTLSASSTSGTVSFQLISEDPVGALSLDQETGDLSVADATLFSISQNAVITGVAEVTDGVETASLSITINLTGGPVIWTGASLSFSKANDSDPANEANQDRITDNVWITRNNEGGPIINFQSSQNNNDGPGDTEWSIGTTAQLEDLQFTSLRDALGGGRGAFRDIVGQDMVLHLVTDDIYIDIRFTSWAQSRGGGFAYTRSTEN